MERHKDEQSVGELFGELTADIRNLVRDEARLARTEISDRVNLAKKDVAYIGVGGLIAYAGLLGIMAFFVIILAYAMPLWLSALIVGVVVAGIGYFFVRKGMNDLKSREFVPRQTMESLREDKEWLRDQTR